MTNTKDYHEILSLIKTLQAYLKAHTGHADIEKQFQVSSEYETAYQRFVRRIIKEIKTELATHGVTMSDDDFLNLPQ